MKDGPGRQVSPGPQVGLSNGSSGRSEFLPVLVLHGEGGVAAEARDGLARRRGVTLRPSGRSRPATVFTARLEARDLLDEVVRARREVARGGVGFLDHG